MIHPTAIVSPQARLGVDVEIGPYTIVDADVTIGDRCRIGPRVSLLAHTELGPECVVHSNAVVGDLPQDFSFGGCVSYVRVGARVAIREGVTIHRGTRENTATEIGDDCLVMGNVHLAHNVRLGRNVVIVNGSMLGGHVEVGDRAFISANALLHQFTRIGRLALIGGGGGITRDVPPFCTTRPVAYNTVVGLNTVGMRRAGIPPEDRTALRHAFHTYYRSDLNVRDALARMAAEAQGACSDEFIAFIAASRRGVCRRVGHDGEAVD